MNPQQQDKAAFFAQYWGQEVKTSDQHRGSGLKPLKIDAHSIQYIDDERYLELKPVSSITDKEVTELLPQLVEDWEDAIADAECSVREFGGAMTEGFSSTDNLEGMNTAQAIATFDFLRSKGYLIPFRNYSTDQILEMGWAKLRNP